MSQKYIKSMNNNSHNAKTYGKYYTKTLIKDVAFEELHENLISAGSNGSGSNTNPSNGTNSGSGSNTGGNSGTSGTGGDNTGGNSGGGDNPGGGSGDDDNMN